MLVEFTVAIDGLARDVRVIQALPELFARPVVRSIYESRYAPARIDGEPVEVRPRMRHTFTLTEGGALWNTDVFGKLKKAADEGVPAAQYIVGAVATLDPTVGISRADGEELMLDAAKGGHPEAQADIGRRFLIESRCADLRKARRWLEPAARDGDPVAAITMVAISAADDREPELERMRGWLAVAARSKNEYALKHALPWLAGLGPPGLADPALALETAQRLEDHGLDEDPQALEGRALALAANGRFPAAARLQKTAVDRARSLSWNVSAMEERLESYAAGRAWSGDPYALPPQANVAPSRNWRKGKVCTALTPLDCPASRTRPDAPPTRRE